MKFKENKSLWILDQILYTNTIETKLDPNSVLTTVLQGSIPLTPVPHEVCMLTGEEAIGFQTNTSKMLLRPDIFQRLVLLDLHKDEYKKLIAIFPQEHYLEEDFYSENGMPIQPKSRYLPQHLWYTPESWKQRLNKTEETHGLDLF